MQCDVPNLRFCWQARYFGGFTGVATTPKIDPFRRKIAPTIVRERAVRTNSGVGRSWTRLGVDLGTSAHPRTLLDAPRAQTRAILSAWTDPDRPTSIDLGASSDPELPASLDLGSSTGPVRWPERPFMALSSWPSRPGSVDLAASQQTNDLPIDRLASHDLQRYACIVWAMPSIDLGASTHSETPTLIDLGAYRAGFPAIGPGIELPCRAQLTIGPGRSGQVSSFPAVLSLPTVRLTYRRACIARSATMYLHRLGHASSLVIL